jgi:VCBS repeat protein
MTARIFVVALLLALFGLPLSGCGGGSSSSGGVGSGLSISLLSPSSVMTGLPIGGVSVYGNGFTDRSQVLIDGVPVIQTILSAPDTLQAETDISLFATAGTHQVSVQNGGQTSNAVTLTVYTPQQGPFVMQAMPGFLVGRNEVDAPFIVAADINGDGLADVIMIGDSASIAILYGQADGTLSTAQQVAVPIAPYALAVGDVDGNGTPDLVSITSDNASSTTVSILAGDGHGNFQPPVAQQTFSGFYPGPAYLADLDGDGKLDLVLGIEQRSGTSSSIVWLKNTGGSFAAPVTLASTYGRSFSVADFNLDGKPDIVYEAPGPPQAMHILLNQGGGKFHDQAAAGLNGVVGVANVLDFNLDGIPDIVLEVSSGQ